MILHCYSHVLISFTYLSDDGEGSFDDDFDKIGNSVSAFHLDPL
jgi:hypothetical protein